MVFKDIGDSLPGSVATWAFSGRARPGTQDHPVYIPHAVRCSVRYMAAEHLFRRLIPPVRPVCRIRIRTSASCSVSGKTPEPSVVRSVREKSVRDPYPGSVRSCVGATLAGHLPARPPPGWTRPLLPPTRLLPNPGMDGFCQGRLGVYMNHASSPGAVALRSQTVLTGSGSPRYSYGGLGGGHPHFHPHTGGQKPNLTDPALSAWESVQSGPSILA